MSDHDPVNHPSHYQIMPGVEVYDVRMGLLAKLHGVAPGAADDWSRAWEYLTRMWGKNGLEDAKKARWYLDKLIGKLEQSEQARPAESRVAVAIDKLASHAELHGAIFAHDKFAPEYPEQRPTCPDCGAPEGELHYVLCPRLPVPEAHAEAVEAAFAEQAQFDEALTDQQQAKPKGCTKPDCFPYCDCGTIDDYVPPAADMFDEARADIIGQNGNDGEHYEKPVDVNDWRAWQVGDVLECVIEVDEGYESTDKIAVGERCEVLEIEPPEYKGALPVRIQGVDYVGWPDFEDYAAAEGAPLLRLFHFHHRPAKTDE